MKIGLSGALLAVSFAGCTCRGERMSNGNAPAPGTTDVGVEVAVLPPADLRLLRTSFFSYGSSTQLPLSHEFTEPVPELEGGLARAAKMRTNADLPVRMQVDREVNYGQLTRLLQAAIGHHIWRWELTALDAKGALRTIHALAPGGYPLGNCFATAWVGPDQRVQLGLDTKPLDAGGAMVGVVVMPREGHIAFEQVLSVLHRLDAQCKEGNFRVLSQPSASFGPVFDLAVAVETAADKPKVGQIQLTVPSIGPLDVPGEVIK